ncbi:AN1-type zinc finger protein 1 isoform X1 [Ranitomeya imitator]|uniref:AN1-type zinc finger protein 1 isoform X1 n=1 Tax=Ranitomeya imitator TaxID=111125 RepID=UPI0037E805E0
MAELEIGQHCDVENCGQLDFLPFVCDGCSRVFCLTHRSRDSHGCPEIGHQYEISGGPTSGIPTDHWKTGPAAAGNELANTRISSAHIPGRTIMQYSIGKGRIQITTKFLPDDSQTTGSSGGGQPEGSTQHPCTYTGCGGKELVEVLCPFCKKHFCLRHRHQPDHKCDQLEAPKPRMAATQQLVKEIVDSKKCEPPSKVRRGAKNAATAAKVALMKLKLQAQGDNFLPQPERVYFQVYLPKGGKDKSKAMFFCKKWSIGKVVDSAASIANLKNDNNKATAKKLRLCHAETGVALPTDGSVDMWLSTAENPLHNGGNIIMEYLDNGCNKIEDPSVYFT